MASSGYPLSSELHKGAVLDRWRGWVICAAAVFCALVYSFRLTSFLHAKEAVLAVCLTLMGLLVAVRGALSWQGYHAFFPLWLVLAFSTAVHLLWPSARAPADTITEIVRWAVLLLIAALSYDLLSDDLWRRRVRGAFVLSAVVAALLGLFQYAGLLPFMFPAFGSGTQPTYSVFGNQGLFGGYLAMALPFLVRPFLVAATVNLPALSGAVVVISGLLISGCRSAWLAAITGVALAFPYKTFRWRRVIAVALVVVGLTVCIGLAAPEITVGRVTRMWTENDQGVRLRLWFWDGTLGMIRDHPLIGVGLGNYAYWSPQYLGEALWGPGGERHACNTVHTLHADSEPLELLAETGPVGIALVVWMLLRLAHARGVEWGGLGAFLVFSLFNAGFHSAPHGLMALLFAGMLSARREYGATPEVASVHPGATRSTALTFATLSIAAGFFAVWAVVWPSYRLRAAMNLHQAGQDPLNAYEQVLRHPWPNAKAHEKYAIALFEADRLDAAREQFLRARAGLDTGDVYLGLGALALRANDDVAARYWLRMCLLRWPFHANAWTLLLSATPPEERQETRRLARRWLSPEEMALLEAESSGE